jgi:hypothetical protein
MRIYTDLVVVATVVFIPQAVSLNVLDVANGFAVREETLHLPTLSIT